MPGDVCYASGVAWMALSVSKPYKGSSDIVNDLHEGAQVITVVWLLLWGNPEYYTQFLTQTLYVDEWEEELTTSAWLWMYV